MITNIPDEKGTVRVHVDDVKVARVSEKGIWIYPDAVSVALQPQVAEHLTRIFNTIYLPQIKNDEN